MANEQTIIYPDKVMERLIERMGGRPLLCSTCGYNRWAGPDFVRLPHNNIGPGIVIGAPTTVLAVLTCLNCGEVRQFNLVQLGIIPDSEGKVHAEPPDAPQVLRGAGHKMAVVDVKVAATTMNPVADKLLGDVFPEQPKRTEH